jgi:hypothetical protein
MAEEMGADFESGYDSRSSWKAQPKRTINRGDVFTTALRRYLHLRLTTTRLAGKIGRDVLP